jgi:hypothetical protein
VYLCQNTKEIKENNTGRFQRDQHPIFGGSDDGMTRQNFEFLELLSRQDQYSSKIRVKMMAANCFFPICNYPLANLLVFGHRLIIRYKVLQNKLEFILNLKSLGPSLI